MGLFNTKKFIGTVKIKFYGEDKASVNYETDITFQKFIDHGKIELFAMYYAKMLYNIGKGEHADLLIEYIQKATDESVKQVFVENKKTGELGIVKSKIKRPFILGTGQKLINDKQEQGTKTYSGTLWTKTYSGTLYEKSNGSLVVKTNMDWGGEGYYAPASVTMFLQYLINSLPEILLVYLMVILNFMNKYYQETGNYSDIHSIVNAPIFGLDSAAQILNLDE